VLNKWRDFQQLIDFDFFIQEQLAAQGNTWNTKDRILSGYISRL
jgi:hypothetical protein